MIIFTGSPMMTMIPNGKSHRCVGSGTQSTANEPGRLGDQSRRMDRIRSRITKDVIEKLWLN
jgi:hypothetical protein